MNPWCPDNSQAFQIYETLMEDDQDQDVSSLSSPVGAAATPAPPSHSLLSGLSILRDRVQQAESLVSFVVSPYNRIDHDYSPAMASSAMGTLAQEIIAAASSMMPAFQQLALDPSGDAIAVNERDQHNIIELAAADLLAKYTHFCQVCGKGFKRDANLRMHMRAHGDQYKTNSALANPAKGNSGLGRRNYYSCPEYGCRWNSRHEKFRPLKSMVCAKNHYRRSHCPKMYVCKRCGGKQFAVLSDLRTHEKQCGGEPRWRCSCGTTFSRKDKLAGHVALFVGHAPAVETVDLAG